MTALVVAAHPDDETLGAGGVTARWSGEGREVHWLILGEGVTSRSAERASVDPAALSGLRRECAAAAEILGAAEVTHAGLPDNRFDSVDLLEVVRIVEETVARTGADLVLTHHPGDVNVDHRITHDAVLAATRPTPGHSVRTLLTFEVPSSSEWSFGSRAPFAPDVFVDISDTVEAKTQALRAYASEVRESPHPRSPEAVLALARHRGATAGVDVAEAFQLVRAIR